MILLAWLVGQAVPEPSELARWWVGGLMSALAVTTVAAMAALARWLWQMPRRMQAMESRLDGLGSELVLHMAREESERQEIKGALRGVHERIDSVHERIDTVLTARRHP